MEIPQKARDPHFPTAPTTTTLAHFLYSSRATSSNRRFSLKHFNLARGIRCDQALPQMSSFFTGTVPAATLQFTVPHEFGHLLWFLDTRFGTTVFGDPNDVMAEGLTVTQDDITAIVGSAFPLRGNPLTKLKCGCK